MLVELKLPPGIRRGGTAFESRGHWYDCNLVRWIGGVMQPIGGWQRLTSEPLDGGGGGMFSFRGARLETYIAVGTSRHLYILGDSTPIEAEPEDFNPGQDFTLVGLGFGAGEFGMDEYGAERSGDFGIPRLAQTWSFDNWGTQLLAIASSDGRLLNWRPATQTDPADTVARVIDEAPIDNIGLVVTNERHVMLLGAGGDTRTIAWSDREDYTTWTPTATNLAGDLRVQTQGNLLAGLKIPAGILLLSDIDAHLATYIGAPLAYGTQPVGDNCGLIGPKAAAAAGDFVAWMGEAGFFVYRGQVAPMECPVWEHVFRDLNQFQSWQITAAHNGTFPEIWWYYPSGGSEYNNRYVVWNYQDNTWYIGYLERDQAMPPGVRQSTITYGRDGHVYEHEVGFGAEVEPREPPYVISAPIAMGSGDRTLYVNQLIPDRDARSLDALRYSFDTRQAPRLPPRSFGPYRPDSDGYTDVRLNGRQVVMRVEVAVDVDWRMGVLRADAQLGGRR